MRFSGFLIGVKVIELGEIVGVFKHLQPVFMRGQGATTFGLQRLKIALLDFQ